MPPKRSSFSPTRVLLILVAIAVLAYAAIRTQLFGIASIRGESYYPEVVKRITTDGAFIDALGSPITVDASGVFCDYKDFDTGGITAKANCYLPVSGPKGTGNVHAQILKRPGALDGDFFLHIGDKIIRGTN
jgi:expansin (peptidoglycan-binding protein)